MSRIVPKCGYNRNTKKEILFGPLQYGGANFRHLYDQQGLGQLTLFLRHWRQNTVAGQLLKNVVAWAQFTTGMASPILETPSAHIPHLESRWLASLRDYLACINTEMHLDSTGLPPLEREHDGYIMEMILQSQQYTDKEIIRLNYCRLFLNAIMLSDLTDTSGPRLDNGKLCGAPSIISSQSRWMPVRQDKPSEAEWRLWRQANALWSNKDGTLRQPLGDWTLDPSKSRITHFAYKHHQKLFIRTHQSGFIICRRIRSNRFQETESTIPRERIPLQAKPVEVTMSGSDEWHITHITNVLSLTACRPPVATFEDFIHTLEAWECDLLRHTTVFSDAFTINDALQTSFLAGSDGSEKYGTDGAFG